MSGQKVLVYFYFPSSHSHRDFSPVTSQILLQAQNRFNGFPQRRVSKPLKRLSDEGAYQHRAEAPV